MASFEFYWEKDTELLSISVDGDERLTATDTNFSSFSRIYIKGNVAQYYDDIVVTAIPEPDTVAFLAMAGAMLVTRRKTLAQ